MKKFLAAVTAILMLMSLVTVPLFAEEQPPEAQPVVFNVTSAEVKPGDSVAVTVSLAGEYKAHGLNLDLNYDEKVLTIEETDGENDDGDPIKVPWIDRGEALETIRGIEGVIVVVEAAPATETASARVALAVASAKKVFKEEGELITVHFKVADTVEPGTKIPLAIDVKDFFKMPLDGEATPIPFKANNGELTVVGEPETTPVPSTPPTPPTPPKPPKTGLVSLVGAGIAAIIAGAGVVLFRRKK